MPQLIQSSPNTPDGVTIQLNSSGQLEVINYGYNVPIGSAIPWFKSITGVPALPAGFVECNGQVLNDNLSLLDGQTMPDLNVTKRFIRGSSTSGTTGGADTHTLTQAELPAHTHSYDIAGSSASSGTAGTQGTVSTSTSKNTSSIGSGNAHNNLPAYMEAVWIIRVR